MILCSSWSALVSSLVNVARIRVRPESSWMTVRQVDHAGSNGSTWMAKSAHRTSRRFSCMAIHVAFKSARDGVSGISTGRVSSMLYT